MPPEPELTPPDPPPEPEPTLPDPPLAAMPLSLVDTAPEPPPTVPAALPEEIPEDPDDAPDVDDAPAELLDTALEALTPVALTPLLLPLGITHESPPPS